MYYSMHAFKTRVCAYYTLYFYTLKYHASDFGRSHACSLPFQLHARTGTKSPIQPFIHPLKRASALSKIVLSFDLQYNLM